MEMSKVVSLLRTAQSLLTGRIIHMRAYAKSFYSEKNKYDQEIFKLY